MKKIALLGTLALMAAAAFAQDLKAPEDFRGPGGMERERGPGIEWKLGTVVTTEYKQLTGTLTLEANGPATLKADGVDYALWVPRRALAELKTGDTLMVEGPVTTVKADKAVPPSVEAFKITVNGKEVDVRWARPGRGFDDGPLPRR